MTNEALKKVAFQADELRDALFSRQKNFLSKLPDGAPDDEWLEVTHLPGIVVFTATPQVIRGADGRWYARAS